MENTASYNVKGKVKKPKGSRFANKTFISQPFNFEHREHFNKETNNDQTLLVPPSLGNTNLDNGQIGDIRKELGEMERRLTNTFQTEIKIALSCVYCALCANKLEENTHVNQRGNKTKVNEQESYGNLPEEGKEVDSSYDNHQDTQEDICVASKPKDDGGFMTDTDIKLQDMKPRDNSISDNDFTTRTNSTKRPIPVPRTTTSGSDRKANNRPILEVSKSESSLTHPKEAWNEEQSRPLITIFWNEETNVKQFTDQLNNPKLRSNELPSPMQQVKQPRAVRKQSKFDELAKALQLHVQEIVATVVFKDSELPDALTAGGVITEDESSAIRTIVYRKDQIRILLSLIKGRDLHVLDKFLKYVEDHCGSRDLIDKIMSTFEDNKKANITGKSCVLCKVSDQVNIKYVTDKLWSIDVIDDGIYNEVVMCTNPTGSQSDLWHQLICTINNLKGDCLFNAYNALCSTLEEKSHYIHLSEAIKNRTELDPDGELKHSCCDTHIQVLHTLKLGTRNSCDTMTSHSPCSSTHSSARISHDSLQEDYEGNSLPSRNSERGKRPPAMDFTKQTATQESQCDKPKENDTATKRTFLNNNEDEVLHQRSSPNYPETTTPYSPRYIQMEKTHSTEEDNDIHKSEV